jgi:hypothetical protein
MMGQMESGHALLFDFETDSGLIPPLIPDDLKPIFFQF